MTDAQMSDEDKKIARDAALSLAAFADRMVKMVESTAAWTAPGATFEHKHPWDYPELVIS